jgi:RNA polymerase sigma-70 factor (ECF subfamily)
VEPSDEALCRRVALRDETAFTLLVTRHQERAYRLAWSILRNTEDARDLSQEAFVRLYRTAASFRGDAKFSTWFYRILVNLCLDHRRRGRWWRRAFGGDGGADAAGLLERTPAPPLDPLDALGRAQRMKQVWEAVAELPRQQRAALLLHVQEELPTPEIAAVLRCSEATVRVHLHRALTTLRRVMEGR